MITSMLTIAGGIVLGVIAVGILFLALMIWWES